jgi:hypothetical protein
MLSGQMYVVGLSVDEMNNKLFAAMNRDRSNWGKYVNNS